MGDQGDQFVMVDEIKAETKILKFMNLKTMFITIAFALFGFATSSSVYDSLAILYIIFNIFVGLLVSFKSPFNKGKVMYQSIIMLFKNIAQKSTVYHAVSDCETPQEHVIEESSYMYKKV